MKLKIEMHLDNAAYREYAPHPETGELIPEVVAADLKKVADKIEMGYRSGNIIDINGNVVGQWIIK